MFELCWFSLLPFQPQLFYYSLITGNFTLSFCLVSSSRFYLSIFHLSSIYLLFILIISGVWCHYGKIRAVLLPMGGPECFVSLHIYSHFPPYFLQRQPHKTYFPMYSHYSRLLFYIKSPSLGFLRFPTFIPWGDWHCESNLTHGFKFWCTCTFISLEQTNKGE